MLTCVHSIPKSHFGLLGLTLIICTRCSSPWLSLSGLGWVGLGGMGAGTVFRDMGRCLGKPLTNMKRNGCPGRLGSMGSDVGVAQQFCFCVHYSCLALRLVVQIICHLETFSYGLIRFEVLCCVVLRSFVSRLSSRSALLSCELLCPVLCCFWFACLFACMPCTTG